jgi:hypothetical protein
MLILTYLNFIGDLISWKQKFAVEEFQQHSDEAISDVAFKLPAVQIYKVQVSVPDEFKPTSEDLGSMAHSLEPHK